MFGIVLNLQSSILDLLFLFDYYSNIDIDHLQSSILDLLFLFDYYSNIDLIPEQASNVRGMLKSFW